MYSTTTHGIQVSVEATYLDNQSAPNANHYVWAYKVRIENGGAETVQLKTRYWRITDSFGQVQEVHGDGVVGEQPVLSPGESFEYTSGTPLPTPSGIMVGAYQMVTSLGQQLEIEIPAFSLDSPHQDARLN